MTKHFVIYVIEWLFFSYFILIYLVYALLNIIAVFEIRRYLQIASLTEADNIFSSLDLPISGMIRGIACSGSMLASAAAAVTDTAMFGWSSSSSIADQLDRSLRWPSA